MQIEMISIQNNTPLPRHKKKNWKLKTRDHYYSYKNFPLRQFDPQDLSLNNIILEPFPYFHKGLH